MRYKQAKGERRVTQADFRAAGRAFVRDVTAGMVAIEYEAERADKVRACGFNLDCRNGRFNPAHRCDVCPWRPK